MNDCKTSVSLFSLSFSVFCSAYDLHLYVSAFCETVFSLSVSVFCSAYNLHLYVSAFCETVDVPLPLTAKIKPK